MGSHRDPGSIFTWEVNGILSVHLSVMISLSKPLDEIQPNGVQVTDMYGRAKAHFLALGPGMGSKGEISFKFSYKVNFKDFYTKLCVCSQK